jgi:hypothetical protein
MSPLNCAEVESRLDLFAADECDAPEAEAIRRHLATCARCETAYQEAKELLALLDLRLQEPERLQRLEERIAEEEEPRRMVLRFPSAAVRRFAALAAMLLLAVGPLGWLVPRLALVGDGGLVLAVHQEDVLRPPDALIAPGGVEAVRGGPKEAHEPIRDDVKAAKEDDRQRRHAVDLALELRNTTDREMRVEVAGPRTEWHLELKGPGGKVVATPEESHPEKAEAVTLKPGASHTIRITRLEDGHAGDTVTARFTTIASSPGMGERSIAIQSAPVTIPGEGK